MAAGVLTFFEEVGQFTTFAGRVLRALLTRPMLLETALQVKHVAFGSVSVVIFICSFIGANVVVQGYQMLAVLGAGDMTGMFVGLAVVRELGPVMAGAMVGAKAGCEIAAELAAMKLGQQIDALEVMSVDPYSYLVVPRVVGTILGMPLVLAFAIGSAIGSGYLVAVYQYGLNGYNFMEQLRVLLSFSDLIVAAIKCVTFGAVVGLIECYMGFYAKPGPTGVGEATNMAIVVGSIVIAWINLVITGLAY